jgi:hypothetical protein
MIAGTASPETDVPNATYRNHGTHAEAIDLAANFSPWSGSPRCGCGCALMSLRSRDLKAVNSSADFSNARLFGRGNAGLQQSARVVTSFSMFKQD